MPYIITDYSYKQAKNLNVDIKPSTNKNKKIDVFKNGKKVASIGAIHMNDYPTYLKNRDKEFANERRRLYKIRHEKTRHKVGSPSFYADKILW
jgi:hypothetical protein